MAKTDTVQLRLHVDHKESMRGWADRLGISLTMLYQVLAGMNGPDDLTRLIMTEFACKHLQRLGLPPDAPVQIQNSPDTHNALCMLLATAARLEMATTVGDLDTAETARLQMAPAESALLRAYGAAVDTLSTQPTDNEQ